MNGKSGIVFPQNGTGMGEHKHLSLSSGQEEENLNIIPAVWDSNRKKKTYSEIFGQEWE